MNYILHLCALLLCVLAINTHAKEVSVMLHESEAGLSGGAAGMQGGHAAFYMANACSDDPFTVRVCNDTDAPESRGMVFTHTYGIKDGQKSVNWIAYSLSTYLYLVPSLKQRPVFGNDELKAKVREAIYEKLLRERLPRSGGALPGGGWRTSMGQSFIRDTYRVGMDATPKEEERLISCFNRIQSKGRYDPLFANCSDTVLAALKCAYPGQITDSIADAGFGSGMLTSPLGVAEGVYKLGLKLDRPAIFRRHAQIPSDWDRSRPALRAFENLTNNPYYMPVAYFAPIAPLLSLAWYKITDRFHHQSLYWRWGSDELATLAQKLKNAPDDERGDLRRQHKEAALAHFGTDKKWKSWRATFRKALAQSVHLGFMPRGDTRKVADRLISVGTQVVEADGSLSLIIKDKKVRLGQDAIAGDSDPQMSYQILLAALDYETRWKDRNLLRKVLAIISLKKIDEKSNRLTVGEFRELWEATHTVAQKINAPFPAFKELN